MFERDGYREMVQVRPSLVTPDREGLIVAACAGVGTIYVACFDPTLLSSGRLMRLLPGWSCPSSYRDHIELTRSSRSSALKVT